MHDALNDTLRHLKALADETRLRLTLVLQHYELSVNELVTLLGMGQSRVSRHLKILADAGLLQSRRDGLWVFYRAVGDSPERRFLDSVLAYAQPDASDDLAMAGRIIEERALKTRQFFNSIADDWDELNREVLGDFSLPQAIRSNVPANCGIAVDLGCGTGEVLSAIRDLCSELIGVDGSPRMLELAKRRFGDASEHISLRIGELDHLPLRDGEADFACINLVLHHLSDPQIAIDEIARVLRPGGVVMITDFDRHNSEDMRQIYGDRWLGFSSEKISQMLCTAGLELQQMQQQSVRFGLSLHLVVASKTL